MAGRTLTAMARGGIYDQLGGGFARYSVDAQWVVPHFEKMLYDNALLLGVYTHWWRARPGDAAGRARGRRPGRLAAARDADRRGRLRRQPRRRLPRRRRARCTRARSTSGPRTSWSRCWATRTARWAAEVVRRDRGRDVRARTSTLRRRLGRAATGRTAGRTYGPGCSQARERRRATGSRRQGGRRLERLADRRRWSQAAMVFERPGLARARRREAAELVWRLHWDGSRLRRTSRDGGVGAAPGDPRGLRRARPGVRPAGRRPRRPGLDRPGRRRWPTVIEEQFADGAGGFFDTAADAEALYTRPQDPTDNATPSGLSAAVHALRAAGRADRRGRGTPSGPTARPRRPARWSGQRRGSRAGCWPMRSAAAARPPPVQVAIVGRPTTRRRASSGAAGYRAAPAGSVIVAGAGDEPGFALLADRTDGRRAAHRVRLPAVRLPAAGRPSATCRPSCRG